MKKSIINLALAALTILPAAAQQERLQYHNPTGKEFPILAWYSIIGDENVTPERYKELREAGFNISFSHFYDEASLAKGLKASRGTGVKIMAMCSGLEKNTKETVDRYKNEETLAGWFMRDEPNTEGYAELRKFRDRIYTADKKHLIYLNLFPSYVGNDGLKAKSYEDYVQRFVDEVNITQISYDNYPIVDEGGKVFVRPQFYNNLEVVRRVSLRSGYPFWAFCLSTAHMTYPIAQDAHMRLEAFAALAYGAQCIQYFTYFTPGTEVWDFHAAPIDEKGERTPVYYRVQKINREIQTQAKVFLGAKAVDVSQTGTAIPEGTKRLETLPRGFSDLQSDGEGLIVSHLVNGKSNYLMLVSRDIHNIQRFTMKVRKNVKRIMHDGKDIKQRKGTLRVTLGPGDYAIYKW